MNSINKTFAIYCSDGASRILKFYLNKQNLERLRPQKVIYDGERINVIDELRFLFGNDLIVFNKNYIRN